MREFNTVSCVHCADKGLTCLNWADAPEDYAVCLCKAGQLMRQTGNHRKATVPLWRVWCAKWQVDPERVLLIEDVLSADELRARGLVVEPAGDREERLLKAARATR